LGFRLIQCFRRQRLRMDDKISVLHKTGCDGMGVCCEKKMMIA